MFFLITVSVHSKETALMLGPLVWSDDISELLLLSDGVSFSGLKSGPIVG